jgi:hypothetical protein
MADVQMCVTVTLPDSMEEDPVAVLSSIVLGALGEGSIPVVYTACTVQGAHKLDGNYRLVPERIAVLGKQLAEMIDEGAARREASPGVPDDLDELRARSQVGRHADGTWKCVKDGVTEPCGVCSGCREVEAEKPTSMPCERCLTPNVPARIVTCRYGCKHTMCETCAFRTEQEAKSEYPPSDWVRATPKGSYPQSPSVTE